MQNTDHQDDSTIDRRESAVNPDPSSSSSYQTGPSREQLTPSPSRTMRPGSFAPPFPVQPPSASQQIQATMPATPKQSSLTGSPLTNHEIYEMIQKNQQQAGGSPSILMQHQNHPVVSTGSFKQAKSGRHSSSGRFERQDSVIVGTPGFRERYGKYG